MPGKSDRQPLPEFAADLEPLPGAFWRVVDAGLDDMDMTLAPATRAAIDGHVRLLLAWNAAVNLTALRTPEQIARNHVLDSLICVVALRELVAGRGRGSTPPSLIDIGSGAGFPGIPLAIAMPTGRTAVVDSIGKKARFLRVVANHVAEALANGEQPAPEIAAISERAEDLSRQSDQRETWDLVTARAVGTVAEVAELGLPLVRRGGHVVNWKLDSGDGTLEKEIADARRVCQATGGGKPRIIRLAVADRVGLAGHCLVAIEKRGPTPERYPRPAAERRRSPLLS